MGLFPKFLIDTTLCVLKHRYYTAYAGTVCLTNTVLYSLSLVLSGGGYEYYIMWNEVPFSVRGGKARPNHSLF